MTRRYHILIHAIVVLCVVGAFGLRPGVCGAQQICKTMRLMHTYPTDKSQSAPTDSRLVLLFDLTDACGVMATPSVTYGDAKIPPKGHLSSRVFEKAIMYTFQPFEPIPAGVSVEFRLDVPISQQARSGRGWKLSYKTGSQRDAFIEQEPTLTVKKAVYTHRTIYGNKISSCQITYDLEYPQMKPGGLILLSTDKQAFPINGRMLQMAHYFDRQPIGLGTNLIYESYGNDIGCQEQEVCLFYETQQPNGEIGAIHSSCIRPTVHHAQDEDWPPKDGGCSTGDKPAALWYLWCLLPIIMMRKKAPHL